MEIFRQKMLLWLSDRHQKRMRGEEQTPWDQQALMSMAEVLGGETPSDGNQEFDPRIANLFSEGERIAMARLGLKVASRPFLRSEQLPPAFPRVSTDSGTLRYPLPDETLRALAEGGEGRPANEPATLPWTPGSNQPGQLDASSAHIQAALARIQLGRSGSSPPSRTTSARALRRDGESSSPQLHGNRMSWEWRSSMAGSEAGDSPTGSQGALNALGVASRQNSKSSRMGSRVVSSGSFGRLDEHTVAQFGEDLQERARRARDE